MADILSRGRWVNVMNPCVAVSSAIKVCAMEDQRLFVREESMQLRASCHCWSIIWLTKTFLSFLTNFQYDKGQGQPWHPVCVKKGFYVSRPRFGLIARATICLICVCSCTCFTCLNSTFMEAYAVIMVTWFGLVMFNIAHLRWTRTQFIKCASPLQILWKFREAYELRAMKFCKCYNGCAAKACTKILFWYEDTIYP